MTKNIRNAILEEIAHLISIKAIEPIKVNAEQITNRIMCHVSPETTDQRSTDTVVSLAKCVDAVRPYTPQPDWLDPANHNIVEQNARRAAKAVLDAAGVPYGD